MIKMSVSLPPKKLFSIIANFTICIFLLIAMPNYILNHETSMHVYVTVHVSGKYILFAMSSRSTHNHRFVFLTQI